MDAGKRRGGRGGAAFLITAAVLGLILSATMASAAEKYPAKAVTVIHAAKPGGGSDQLAQLVQPFLEKVLKQRFVNVYKPGADGAIGWKEAAKLTKPDGYTLTVCTPPKTIFNYILNANAGYTMADFEPIANMVFDPAILVVGVESKFKTFQDLVEAAKKAPGQLRLAHSGNGSDDWYNAVMTAKLAGINLNMVPFEGDAPSWQAAAGSHVDVSMNNVGVVSSLVQGKKLRALAVCTEKRIPALPDVPTLKELGVNHVGGVTRGYYAPKGTPKEIVETLADALEKVSQDPQYKAACTALNMVPDFRRGEPLKTSLAQEEEMLRRIAKEMKLSQ